MKVVSEDLIICPYDGFVPHLTHDNNQIIIALVCQISY